MVLTVKVSPGARQTAIKRFENNILYVSVAAAPEKGQANEELVRFLAKQFKISPREISILSGANGRMKRVKMPQKNESLTKLFQL